MPKAVEKIVTTCIVCGTRFARLPSFHRSAEAKGGKVKYCSMKCHGVARSTGLIKPHLRTGKVPFTCQSCGKEFTKWPAAIRYAANHGKQIKFCSLACVGKAKTSGMILMPKGTALVNKKRSDGNRAAWGLPPHDPHMMSLPKKVRARLARGIGFNNSQLKAWLGTECVRCGSTEKLELDHILCMAAGGKSVKENSQTLCFTCNKKKMKEDRLLTRQLRLLGGKQER